MKTEKKRRNGSITTTTAERMAACQNVSNFSELIYDGTFTGLHLKRNLEEKYNPFYTTTGLPVA